LAKRPGGCRPTRPDGPPDATAGRDDATTGAPAEAALPSVSSLKARLARGAANAFLINALGTGMAFLSQLLLARVLGVDGYGVYAYVIAWVTVLAPLAALGFQTGLLRFAAAYRERGEWALLRGVIRYAERRVLLAGVITGLALAAGVVGLGDRLAPELALSLLVGCGLVPLLAMLQVRSSIVRAFGGVVSALAPQLLVRHAILVVIIGIWGWVLSSAIAPHSAMAVTLLATLLALAVVSLAQRRLRPAGVARADVVYRADDWWRASAILLVMTGTQALLRRTDLLMLGWFADSTSVGVYAVASRVADLVAFALTAINTIFAPSIAALHARGDRSALQAMVTTTSWWATVAGLVIALPLFALAPFVLSIFGAEFTAGATALRILLAGQIVNAAAGSVSFMLTMTGHERQAAVVLGSAAAASVVLNTILIPMFGLEGAAVATTLSVTGWNLALAVLVWGRLKIVPSLLGRR
jgi:O-antigen/teichoic acid export membrane protein